MISMIKEVNIRQKGPTYKMISFLYFKLELCEFFPIEFLCVDYASRFDRGLIFTISKI